MNDLPFATWVTVSLLAAYLPAAVKIASNHSRMSNKNYSVSSGLARDAQISVHRLSERLTTYSGREAMVIFETWLPDIYGILSDCLRTLDWLRRSYTLLINYQLQCALEGKRSRARRRTCLELYKANDAIHCKLLQYRSRECRSWE